MRSYIYFIAGASGSGKTSIMPHLKQILGTDIAVYDFDEIGVPEGADRKWRHRSTEEWIKRLLDKGHDACLLGQTVLGEILACPSASRIKKLNFCLLDVSDVERILRLKTRSTHGVDQHTLNWAAWMRVHSHMPKWAQHVIKEDSWEKMDFGHWDKLEKWEDLANITFINTTGKKIEEVASEVAQWVRGCCR